MTRMTRPDCAVMCNLINTHTHTKVSLIPPCEDQREWHRMTRMTRPDCAVMCNLIHTHIHTHTNTNTSCRRHLENRGNLGRTREKNRKYRVGPVAANPNNLENSKEAEGRAQDTQGLSNKFVQVERVCRLYCV